jgi:hypothetical protein
MKPTNIELHIEELVLHGFEPGDRHRIADAVERELDRLFTQQGAQSQLALSNEIGHLDAGAFEVTAGSRPEMIGAQVAQALYRRVGL